MLPGVQRRRRAGPPPTLLLKPATSGSFATIVGDLQLVAHHLVEADALHRLGADVEAPLILARQEALRHEREQVTGADQQRDRHRHRHDVEAQARRAASSRRARSQPRRTSARSRCRTTPCFCVCGGFRKRLHSIGVRLIDTKPDTRIATPIVTANSCSSRPTTPPMNSTGMNTAASDTRHRQNREGDFLRPVERRPHRRLAHLHVPDDVLQHHDRVVDDEADRERQRHQRQVVEAVVEQVHHREGRDDRGRQREARDDRRRDVPQEQEDHEHDEARRSAPA